jgi:hypothetical protein
VVQEETAARNRVEQSAIAVAERVGRELVQLAFSAATSKQQASAGAADPVLGSMRAIDDDPLGKQGDATGADGAWSASQTRERSGAEVSETSFKATLMRLCRRVGIPVTWTMPAPVLPWLAALTLAVLYLLVRSFG